MLKHHIVLLFVTVFLCSCAVYHPQGADIPLIDHKGEIRIDLGASLIPSVHSTFSYGLTNNIAIQAFSSFGIENRHYLQFAPGIYKSLNNKKVIEIYAGIGFGHANTIKNPFANMPEAIKQSLYGNYQLYFSQFNWGKNTSDQKKLDWAIGLKTGLFHSIFTDMNYYSISADGNSFQIYTENHLLLEPEFVFRTGQKKTKFNFKIGVLKFISLKESYHTIPAPSVNLSLGVNFKL